VNFVRPGLVISIASAAIAQDGNHHGTGQDCRSEGAAAGPAGCYDPGNGDLEPDRRLHPKGKTQYVSYATRVQGPSPVTGNSATQATADSGGAWTTNADGDYTYTFKTKPDRL